MKYINKTFSLILIFAMLLAITGCSNNEDYSKVKELESRIEELEGQQSSELSAVEPLVEVRDDIDLEVVAKQIIEKYPPAEGVELVWETEDKSKIFNLDKEFISRYPESDIDLSLINSFVYIHNPNPNSQDTVYSILIANVNSTTKSEVQTALASAVLSLQLIREPFYNDFGYISEDVPSGFVDSRIYNVRTQYYMDVEDYIKELLSNH